MADRGSVFAVAHLQEDTFAISKEICLLLSTPGGSNDNGTLPFSDRKTYDGAKFRCS